MPGGIRTFIWDKGSRITIPDQLLMDGCLITVKATEGDYTQTVFLYYKGTFTCIDDNHNSKFIFERLVDDMWDDIANPEERKIAQKMLTALTGEGKWTVRHQDGYKIMIKS